MWWATFTSAFALGTFLFWALTGIFLIWAFISVVNDKIGASLICLILYFSLTQILGSLNAFGYIMSQPINFIINVVIYIALGILWSIIKWWVLALPEMLDKYKKERMSFIQGHIYEHNNKRGLGVLPPSYTSEKDITEESPVPAIWLEEWRRKSAYLYPKASIHKAEITHWAMFWPISFLWALLSNFIKKVFEKIVTAFRGIYDALVRNVFKGINSAEFKE